MRNTPAIAFYSFALLAISGCSTQPPAPQVVAAPTIPTVPAADVDQANAVASAFVKAVNEHNSSDAIALTTAGMRQAMPIAKLMTEAPPKYQSFFGSQHLHIASADFTSHGKRIVGHTSYTFHGHKYLTNVIFAVDGSSLRIDSIIPPTKPGPPGTRGAQRH